MKLVDLLKKLKYTCVQGTVDVDITTVIYDSRKVENGSLTDTSLPKWQLIKVRQLWL